MKNKKSGHRGHIRPLLLGSVFLGAALPAQNLLANPGFSRGMASWVTTRSTAAIANYGDPGLPSMRLSTAIGGGGALLRDAGGGATVEQVVPLGNVPANTNLLAGGFFGGSGGHHSRLVILFRDSTHRVISRHNLAAATEVHRNFETVLLKRQELLAIPVGASEVVARIEFHYACCSTPYGAADELFLRLVRTSLIPPPLPTGVGLLTNPGFESGWSAGSPLTPADLSGWQGSGPAVRVKTYSNVDPEVPVSAVSTAIRGGTSLLSDHGAGGVIRQRRDLRGNAPQINAGKLALQVSAFLGGARIGHAGRVDIRFLDANLTTIGAPPPLGAVTHTERNGETTVALRKDEFLIPRGTAYFELDVVFQYACCAGAAGLVDNVQAKLVAPSLSQPVPLDVNLVKNGSFESGSLPGSPLQLTECESWRGGNASAVKPLPYGSPFVPSVTFARRNLLGNYLLVDVGGNAMLRQEIDLSGSQAAIDAGRYVAGAEVWLGGAGSLDHGCRLRVRFVTSTGALRHEQTLGPVSAAQRGNQTTLLRKAAQFAVPSGSARAIVDLLFSASCCGAPRGLVDDVRLVLHDAISGGPFRFKGTGEDLRLLTGVDGPLRSGLGHEIKYGKALSILDVSVISPKGDFDFAPLLLAANVIQTGSTLRGSLPGIILDVSSPTFVLLVNGFGCGGFGCAKVLPGGSAHRFVIPAGMNGMSILLQGVAFPGAKPPRNGRYASTEGHEIRIR